MNTPIPPTIYGDSLLKTIQLADPAIILANTVTDLGSPINPLDATNKQYVDSKSTSPGGSDQQVQFNNNGAFAGSSGFTFNKSSTDALATVAGSASSLIQLGETLTIGNSPFTYANDHLYSTSGLVMYAEGTLDVRATNGPMTIGLENVGTINFINSAIVGRIDSSGNFFMTLGVGQQLGVTDSNSLYSYLKIDHLGPGVFFNNGDNVLSFIQADDYQMSFNPGTTNYVKLSNVANPTNSQDAATKNYVDTSVSGVSSGTANTVLYYNASGNLSSSSSFEYNGSGTMTATTISDGTASMSGGTITGSTANIDALTTTGITQLGNTGSVGFFGKTPVGQQSPSGNNAISSPGIGTAVLNDTTFAGATGSTAYSIGDIVTALKNLGLMAQ